MIPTTEQDYQQVVYGLILKSPVVKITAVGVDMRLSDIKMDSLEKLSLAMDLEEVYDIEISDDEVEAFESVADIVTYLEQSVST